MKKAKPVILMDSFRDIRESKKRSKSNIGLLGASRSNMRVGINKGQENHRNAIRRLKFAIRNHCRDCCGGINAEIDKCQVKKCSLWGVLKICR